MGDSEDVDEFAQNYRDQQERVNSEIDDFQQAATCARPKNNRLSEASRERFGHMDTQDLRIKSTSKKLLDQLQRQMQG